MNSELDPSRGAFREVESEIRLDVGCIALPYY